LEAGSADDIERAFQTAVREHVEAMVPLSSAFFNFQRERMVSLAVNQSRRFRAVCRAIGCAKSSSCAHAGAEWGRRAVLSAGRIDEARSHTREALALTRRLRARGSEAHALCLTGDVASTVEKRANHGDR
jgi:hypothetical protein